jgi:hypothetical protein
MSLILIFFILIFLIILIYHIKDNKKVHENFSIPKINLDNYGDIYLNIGQNTENNNANNDAKINNLNENNNLKNNSNLQNINYNSKDSIYGIYAWTNNPDFYIPSKDGIY